MKAKQLRQLLESVPGDEEIFVNINHPYDHSGSYLESVKELECLPVYHSCNRVCVANAHISKDHILGYSWILVTIAGLGD
jgi:hypothetical protein